MKNNNPLFLVFILSATLAIMHWAVTGYLEINKVWGTSWLDLLKMFGFGMLFGAGYKCITLAFRINPPTIKEGLKQIFINSLRVGLFVMLLTCIIFVPDFPIMTWLIILCIGLVSYVVE